MIQLIRGQIGGLPANAATWRAKNAFLRNDAAQTGHAKRITSWSGKRPGLYPSCLHELTALVSDFGPTSEDGTLIACDWDHQRARPSRPGRRGEPRMDPNPYDHREGEADCTALLLRVGPGAATGAILLE